MIQSNFYGLFWLVLFWIFPLPKPALPATVKEYTGTIKKLEAIQKPSTYG